ncbi:hypothetical protein N7466_002676 [Penicillium verhagenii]|uniref:uncharacterized protein n=1 Tax=Penicillium verhagenii TaxID=1562060 RepID=UPI002545283F|nr:uncharacterized protein N7466_002676 [Penicillium verhagenii]KAJ5939542.1 hypothetical protein N7466_002676 [Penicillium verhagenii]
MTFIKLRARAPLRLSSLRSPRLSSSTLLRSLSTRTTGTIQQKNPRVTAVLPQSICKLPSTPSLRVNCLSTPLSRQYSTETTKPTADTLIEELQDLYEIAKDEFEIATESTDGGTIYAASDRDSARDALNEFCATYFLYTCRPGEEDTGVVLRSGEAVSGSRLLEAEVVTLGEEEGEGPVVDTKFDPASVEVSVRDEVRRRIGQRVRELRNAVELLEERAHSE